MRTKRTILIVFACLIALIVISAFVAKNHIQRQVKELFRMNKSLQEEGYYMAEFEFRMVGFGYYLDKGNYLKSLKMLSDYHYKLKNKEGLIKVPDFKNNQDEINFFLNLQNPNTGAFIDETAPFCVYYEVSKNVVDHIVSLTDSTTAPLKLKYPITFLDSINTPKKLIAHLDDISYVGWLASKFPQTTFHFARNLLDATRSDNTFEAYNLYTFSPEWKHAMLQWMYDFQDAESGMWGPKNRRTGKLCKYDLNNTASILKSFRDKEGNDLHKEFPLNYQDKLFKSALKELSEPFPDEDDLVEIHEWNLRQAKGLAMLLRYIWKDASDENKRKAVKIIERNIDICFDKYYVEAERAFSYYPESKHASCDGISNLIYGDIGAFFYKKQKKLWGDPLTNTKNLGDVTHSELKVSDFTSIVNTPDVNSIRIYVNKPNFERLTDSVWAVYYPKATQVLDVMELVPNIVHWTETSSLSMGNWTSLAEIKNEYSSLNIKKPLIFKENLSIKKLNKIFENAGQLYMVGFDKLQIPGSIKRFKHSK